MALSAEDNDRLRQMQAYRKLRDEEMSEYTENILREVERERRRQIEAHGYDVVHDDHHTNEEWVAIIVREMFEIPWGGYHDARQALVKVAAVAVAAVEALDTKNGDTD